MIPEADCGPGGFSLPAPERNTERNSICTSLLHLDVCSRVLFCRYIKRHSSNLHARLRKPTHYVKTEMIEAVCVNRGGIVNKKMFVCVRERFKSQCRKSFDVKGLADNTHLLRLCKLCIWHSGGCIKQISELPIGKIYFSEVCL